MRKVFGTAIFLVFFLMTNGQPLTLHPLNPHYFLFRGKPLVIVSSGEHYGAVLNPDFDYIKYLNTLQKEGMVYTRLFTGTYFERAGSFGIEKNTLAPASGKALIPWKRNNEPGNLSGGNKFDLDRWDDNYFSRLNSFVSEASKRGIVVEISLFSSIYGYWDIQPWNNHNNTTIKDSTTKEAVQTLFNGSVLGYQEKVVRKIVKELNSYDNIIYEIQNEPWSDHSITVEQKSEYFNRQDFVQAGTEWRNKVDIADEASLEWQKRIASFIVDEERNLKNKHLIAQNYCNFYYPVTEVDNNVSVMNFHYCYPVVVEQNYDWNRVISFDESGFAGNEDVTYRKQAWNFIIAGGGLFNNLDYSFSVGKEDGTAVNKAPGGGSTNLRRQLKILSDFINSFDILKLKPDLDVVIHSPGSFARALSEPGKQYAIYIHGGSKSILKLGLPEGEYEAEWVSTKDGTVLKSESINSNGDIVLINSPVYQEDIALKILRSK